MSSFSTNKLDILGAKMSKRVLITGIGGFSASHTCEHILKNTDWQIVGIDSFRHKGDSLRLARFFTDEYKNRLKVIAHDLACPISDRMIEEIGPIDYVFAIASDSHVERSITDPVPFVKNNVALSLETFEYARKAKPKAVILQSTDEVFGPALAQDKHTEWMSFKPSNPYAASKAAQDAIAFSYWRTYGVPVVINHVMNLIGQYQDKEKFVPMVISKVLKGETVSIHADKDKIGTRMYLHCRNLADAQVFLLNNITPEIYTHDVTNYQEPSSYNIAGLEEVDNLTMAQKIAEFVGKPLKYELVNSHQQRPGHDLMYRLDSTKISKLGWKAPVPLWHSVQQTVEWALKKENRIWLI